jgi:hypothetical protein
MSAGGAPPSGAIGAAEAVDNRRVEGIETADAAAVDNTGSAGGGGERQDSAPGGLIILVVSSWRLDNADLGAVQARIASGGQSVVYEFFDANGARLYVGVTDDLERRFGGHRAKVWWPLVVRCEVEPLATRRAAELVEAHLIATANPPHNVIGVSDRRLQSLGGGRPKPNGLLVRLPCAACASGSSCSDQRCRAVS